MLREGGAPTLVGTRSHTKLLVRPRGCTIAASLSTWSLGLTVVVGWCTTGTASVWPTSPMRPLPNARRCFRSGPSSPLLVLLTALA
jgi:hypothetical protein